MIREDRWEQGQEEVSAQVCTWGYLFKDMAMCLRMRRCV